VDKRFLGIVVTSLTSLKRLEWLVVKATVFLSLLTKILTQK